MYPGYQQPGGYPPQQYGQQPYPPSGGYPQPGGMPVGNPMAYMGQVPPAGGPMHQPQMGGHPQMGGQHQGWYSKYYNMLQQKEIHELQMWFRGVDRDNSGSITANELQMVTFGGFPLGMDIAIKLVKVFDKDRSGTIDFFEYASMHKFITLMQQAFAQGDRDRSGTLDAREIHQALGVSGFRIGFGPTQLFFNKVSRGQMHIPFPAFLQLGADIALLKSKFEWMDTRRQGFIQLNFDQLLEVCADL